MEEIQANEEDEKKELHQLVSHYATVEGPPSVIKFQHQNYSFFDREETGTELTRIFRDPFAELQNKIKKVQEYAPTQEVAYTKAYISPPNINDNERLLQVLCLLYLILILI